LLFLHIGSGLRIRHPFEGSLEASVGFLSLFCRLDLICGTMVKSICPLPKREL